MTIHVAIAVMTSATPNMAYAKVKKSSPAGAVDTCSVASAARMIGFMTPAYRPQSSVSENVNCELIYSVRSASVGLTLAARIAG